MPLYEFKCDEGHYTEVLKTKPYSTRLTKKGNLIRRRVRCRICGLWAYRIVERVQSTKPLNLDYNRDPLSHLVRQRSFKGRWIENLTPSPVLVKNEAQYQKLLKDTNSREKEA